MFCPHERDVILIKALASPASLEQFFGVFANNKNDLFKIGSLPPSLRKKKNKLTAFAVTHRLAAGFPVSQRESA